MAVRTRRDLGRMRHRDRLYARGELRKPDTDRIGNRSADAGVDLIKHQRWRGTLVRQHHLQREQKTRKLAAGRDLHQRAGPRAGIGLHPEFRAVEAMRTGSLRIDRNRR